MGWAWGQPAVSDTRAYIGTAGMAKYPVRLVAQRSEEPVQRDLRAGIVEAVERTT